MPVKEYIKHHGAAFTHAKIWTDDIEAQAWLQITKLTQLPFIHKHIAVMPDVHAGNGSTIGSVIPTKGAIIPAAVGVDIGCGMMATKTSLTANDLPDNLSGLRSRIEAAIPHGRTDHGGPNDKGGWNHKGYFPFDVEYLWLQMTMNPRYRAMIEKYPELAKNVNDVNHLGTLGTGNHFIEICLDEEDNVWVMLHSGSRGIGNKIGSHFISLAKEDMKKWFINVPDVELAYFPEHTEHFNDYIDAMTWAQDYAALNREIMMARTIGQLGAFVGATGRSVGADYRNTAINCHHNYATKENHFGANVWVTRKGAVRARTGDMGIIPGSMGEKSYIVRGLGNADAFCSCSHGAGRRMSRGDARRQFTAADLAAATEGIECRKDDGVVDEIPAAYKSIDAVMENQSDLVEVVTTLRQIVNVKG
jgi:tRNA-splicing ligase RtcB